MTEQVKEYITTKTAEIDNKITGIRKDIKNLEERIVDLEDFKKYLNEMPSQISQSNQVDYDTSDIQDENYFGTTTTLVLDKLKAFNKPALTRQIAESIQRDGNSIKTSTIDSALLRLKKKGLAIRNKTQQGKNVWSLHSG